MYITYNIAQRRPGPRPRRHHFGQTHGAPAHAERSTKAGAETPATLGASATKHEILPLTPSAMGMPSIAQRRPGPRPRRHRGPFIHAILASRSTKAGAETPATRARSSGSTAWPHSAQRRPGPRPRRHAITQLATPSKVAFRSTKAGAETPATQAPLVPPVTGLRDAQRRPGPRPRRHSLAIVVSDTLLTRSTKAGAETPATRPPRTMELYASCVRSTKAGAETPATHVVSCR